MSSNAGPLLALWASADAGGVDVCSVTVGATSCRGSGFPRIEACRDAGVETGVVETDCETFGRGVFVGPARGEPAREAVVELARSATLGDGMVTEVWGTRGVLPTDPASCDSGALAVDDVRITLLVVGTEGDEAV